MKKITLSVATLTLTTALGAATADDKAVPMLTSVKPSVTKDTTPTCNDLPKFAALSLA